MSITRTVKAKKLRVGMVLRLLDAMDLPICNVSSSDGKVIVQSQGTREHTLLQFSNEERVCIYNET